MRLRACKLSRLEEGHGQVQLDRRPTRWIAYLAKRLFQKLLGSREALLPQPHGRETLQCRRAEVADRSLPQHLLEEESSGSRVAGVEVVVGGLDASPLTVGDALRWRQPARLFGQLRRRARGSAGERPPRRLVECGRDL